VNHGDNDRVVKVKALTIETAESASIVAEEEVKRKETTPSVPE
jgi:hypothetical protein